jgi:hypothetical protein
MRAFDVLWNAARSWFPVNRDLKLADVPRDNELAFVVRPIEKSYTIGTFD